MKKTLISIIIPAYNVNKYIEECIESLISIEELEILLIDDGSLEDLSFIENKYKNRNNFKYYKKENGGLSDARNFGIKKATQEYIMFLDGDDFVDTEKLKKCINYIKNTKKEVYYYKYTEYYENAQENILEKKYSYDNSDYMSIEDKEFLENPFIMVAWRYIVKREIILRENLYFKVGIYHEDEEWTPRLLTKLDKIYNLKENLLFYRQREGSIMASLKYKHISDIFLIIESLLNYKKTLSDENKRKFINNKCLILYRGLFFRSTQIKLSKVERLDFIKKMKCLKKRLEFNNEIKNKIVKYVPIKILILINKLRNK